jgi:hypothetical protein
MRVASMPAIWICRTRARRDDLVLHRERVGAVGVGLVGPEMGAAVRIDAHSRQELFDIAVKL